MAKESEKCFAFCPKMHHLTWHALYLRDENRRQNVISFIRLGLLLCQQKWVYGIWTHSITRNVLWLYLGN